METAGPLPHGGNSREQLNAAYDIDLPEQGRNAFYLPDTEYVCAHGQIPDPIRASRVAYRHLFQHRRSGLQLVIHPMVFLEFHVVRGGHMTKILKKTPVCPGRP